VALHERSKQPGSDQVGTQAGAHGFCRVNCAAATDRDDQVSIAAAGSDNRFNYSFKRNVLESGREARREPLSKNRRYSPKG